MRLSACSRAHLIKLDAVRGCYTRGPDFAVQLKGSRTQVVTSEYYGKQRRLLTDSQ